MSTSTPSVPDSRPSAAGEGGLTEWLLRTFAVLVLTVVVARWGHAWFVDRERWSALLLLVSESYTLVLVLVARRAVRRDLSLPALVATAYAMGFVLLITPDGTRHLAPEGLGAGIQFAALLWQLAAKVVLGRSFGLLPAQRGLVVAGPYRLVRHPIYFGYLVGHVGFLLVNFSWRNVLVLALLYAAQVVRIAREEAVLAKDNPAHRAYRDRVRWRLLPFVY